MNIRYTGPLLDYSGYGEANRHDLGALLSQDINVTTRIPRYTREQTDYDALGVAAKDLEDAEMGFNINIIHTTPDQFGKMVVEGKYNIGRVFWETDKLPPDFANGCMYLDEIWTGSEFNKQAIINAGVDKPVYIVPEAIDTTQDFTQLKPYKTKADRTFTFYSIFEWTERKNPDTLLRAFWQEFTEADDVSLVMKTYLDDFSITKKIEISQAIGAIKSALNQPYYPQAYVYRELMDRKQIYRFHKSFDCYVSPHRGEGWGIPQMEAMLLGKPIISSNLGGIHEYLTDGKDALLLKDITMVPVSNTRNTQWYLGDQKWGSPTVAELRQKMRWVYENKKEAVKIGEAAKKTVEAKFSLDMVGKIMKKRLNEIQGIA